MKGAWGDGPFDFAGEHYTITAYDALPKPVQQPRPPILVGGGGRKVLTPRRARGRHRRHQPDPPRRRDRRRRGARHARRLDRAQDRVGARRRGGALRRRSSSRSATSWPRSPTTPQALAEALAPAFGVDADEALASGGVLAGTVDEVCDTLVRRREEWGVSYVVFGDDQLRAVRAGGGPPRRDLSRPGSRAILVTHADVAQLVEHNLAKVGVAGSNPVVRSTKVQVRPPLRRGPSSCG